MISKAEIEVPQPTTSQMIEVDRLMIEEYQIELIQMMENAGRSPDVLVWDCFFNNSLSGGLIEIQGKTNIFSQTEARFISTRPSNGFLALVPLRNSPL